MGFLLEASGAGVSFDAAFESAGGREHFFSMEDAAGLAHAYLRLRFPGKPHRPELRDAAVVRELKVLGQALPIGARGKEALQHRGLGHKLMARAEEEAAASPGCARVAVTSGVGARGYYRELGYRLEGAYMVKDLG